MFKRLLVTVLFCLISVPCFAGDYFEMQVGQIVFHFYHGHDVFIREYNKRHPTHPLPKDTNIAGLAVNSSDNKTIHLWVEGRFENGKWKTHWTMLGHELTHALDWITKQSGYSWFHNPDNSDY